MKLAFGILIVLCIAVVGVLAVLLNPGLGVLAVLVSVLAGVYAFRNVLRTARLRRKRRLNGKKS